MRTICWFCKGIVRYGGQKSYCSAYQSGTHARRLDTKHGDVGLRSPGMTCLFVWYKIAFILNFSPNRYCSRLRRKKFPLKNTKLVDAFCGSAPTYKIHCRRLFWLCMQAANAKKPLDLRHLCHIMPVYPNEKSRSVPREVSPSA